MSATAIVFLGPSLPLDEARERFPEAMFRPPARQGDVLRALRDRPAVIALIDGVFEAQPSVWHQELRVALGHGVSVLGASSMGALRAAELAPCGMIGVGAIFRAYRDGRLIDDSDVALLHADAEHRHRPLTVPLVNVISQAEHAIDAGVLSTSQGRRLVSAARAIHYKQRHWRHILDAVRWPAERVAAFEQLRREHPCDAKADDARECLQAARALARTQVAPPVQSDLRLSNWVRARWLQTLGEVPDVPHEPGLRTLLLAEWAQSLGVRAPPDAVARHAARLPLDLPQGLVERWSRALALEALLLERPSLVSAHAPMFAEGGLLAASMATHGPRPRRRIVAAPRRP